MKQLDKDHFEDTERKVSTKGENLTEQCEGNEKKEVNTKDQEGDHSRGRRA